MKLNKSTYSEMHLMLCSWKLLKWAQTQFALEFFFFFIMKLQMYYNKAYCNIYNPVLITMSVSLFFFLDWNVLKFNVTLKCKFSIYLSIRLFSDIAWFRCFSIFLKYCLKQPQTGGLLAILSIFADCCNIIIHFFHLHLRNSYMWKST